MIVPATRENIELAARILRDGGLVAFPTETVYGLGANALSEEAIAKIYAAKGRPRTSPLIVHVSSAAMARSLTAAWPDSAERLAQSFWPGPLTLVLPKTSQVPAGLSAGLSTIGLRMPRHSVALALIGAAGVPLAAPSANRFTELSPTQAEHVESALGGAVEMILDGGACEVGIESTVLSLSGSQPVLLRPGMIGQAELEAVIGSIQIRTDSGAQHSSPGLHAKHYSPRTPLYLVRSQAELPPAGRGYWLALAGRTPADYATRLYETLHDLDRQGWNWIAVEVPPSSPEWDGVRDRLKRASKDIETRESP